MSRRLCNFIGHHIQVFLIEIQSTPPNFVSSREEMGTNLTFSMTFLTQIDGQSERMIQVIEEILRVCIIRINFFHYRSFHATTIITLEFKCHYLRNFMQGRVVHLFGGLSLVMLNLWTMTW